MVDFSQALAFALRHQTDFFQAGGEVCIGREGELDDQEHAILKNFLLELGPWRTGPYRIFGQPVRSHYRSDLKWQRALQVFHPEDVRIARIADVGANSGYFMFRLAAHPGVNSVTGFDPVEKFNRQFLFLSGFIESHPARQKISNVKAGFEAITRHEPFDLILLMGVLYHRTDPYVVLKACHEALAKDGQLLLETMGIAGDDPVFYLPRSRYAGTTGNWFLPTLPALERLLLRAGFAVQGIAGASPAEEETEWPPLAGRLSRDLLRTIEGDPAPVRFMLVARRA